MEIGKIVKKALMRTCVYFTVVTAIYMLVMQFTHTGEGHAAVQAYRVLLYFVFSSLLAVAYAVRSIKAIPTALRYLCHYIICLFGFYTCFMLPVGMTRAATVLVGVVLFTIAYLIIIGVMAIFTSRLKANREATQKYSKQFENVKSTKGKGKK